MGIIVKFSFPFLQFHWDVMSLQIQMELLLTNSKNVNLLKSKTICILGFLLNYFDIRTVLYLYLLLEIKPCGLGSRIQDMEAESYN